MTGLNITKIIPIASIPANCDQKNVLVWPTFSEALLAKKSEVPHPNIPPNPAKILIIVLFITNFNRKINIIL